MTAEPEAEEPPAEDGDAAASPSPPGEGRRREPRSGRGWRAGSPRCPGCALQPRLCLCGELRRLSLRTHVVVVSHWVELRKPSNTARLVPLTLEHGEIRSRGQRGAAPILPDEVVRPGRVGLLLFPSEDARVLAASDASPEGPPVTLVVPDGTWPQARKAARREPALAGLPRVCIPDGAPSRYRLRRHINPRFLATFESIARALGILEGPAVQAELERVFDLMVERVLGTRGRLPAGWISRGTA